MQFARPRDGFKVTWTSAVDALRLSHWADPDFQRHWGDLVERLAFMAHRDGAPEPRLGNGKRLAAYAADHCANRPRFVVGYLVLGDGVTIHLLRISY